MATAAKTHSRKETLLEDLAAWTVKRLFRLTILASAAMATICVSFLFYARSLPDAHQFRRDALANLAASCAEIAIGTLFAALVGWAVAKTKLLEISRPVLALIQRLRIDGRLTPEAARCSVVCAVALISETNVRKIIRPRASEATTDCPICAKDVDAEMNRCFHCHLPKTIWRDDEFLKVHIANPTPKRVCEANDEVSHESV